MLHRITSAPLLRDDDRGGLRAGGNLAFDFLDGEIDGELVLRIRRGKLRLVGLDGQPKSFGPSKTKKPDTLGRREADPGCRAYVSVGES